MFNKKTFFITTLSIFVVMYLLIEVVTINSIVEFRRDYSASVIKPVTFAFLNLSVVSFSLLFFSRRVFNLWKKYVFLWYAPLAFIIIASGKDYTSYSWFTKTDMAILLGQALVAITLVFVLIQKFYFKR